MNSNTLNNLAINHLKFQPHLSHETATSYAHRDILAKIERKFLNDKPYTQDLTDYFHLQLEANVDFTKLAAHYKSCSIQVMRSKPCLSYAAA